MNLIRWQPFNELMTLRQAMDKLLEDSYVTPSRLISTFAPDTAIPVDMYHADNDVVVKATLSGVKPGDVDLTITDGRLNIKGETKADEEIKQENYLYKEHRYGAFSRSVTLPDGLDTDKAEANFDNGTLTITIPKSAKIKPQPIKIKAKGATESKK
jgi:HSP20 family protein